MAIALAYIFALIFKSLVLLFLMAMGVALAIIGSVPLALGHITPLVKLERAEIGLLIFSVACGLALFIYAGAGLAAYIMPHGIPIP